MKPIVLQSKTTFLKHIFKCIELRAELMNFVEIEDISS